MCMCMLFLCLSGDVKQDAHQPMGTSCHHEDKLKSPQTQMWFHGSNQVAVGTEHLCSCIQVYYYMYTCFPLCPCMCVTEHRL